MRRAASSLVLALLLTGCATTPAPEPTTRRATLPPQEITIQTAPGGGLVDLNGEILGRAPVILTITPEAGPYATHPRWPYNGHTLQILRARWPDGSTALELFKSETAPPHQVGIVSPNYRPNPLLDSLISDASKPRPLTQKTGP